MRKRIMVGICIVIMMVLSGVAYGTTTTPTTQPAKPAEPADPLKGTTISSSMTNTGGDLKYDTTTKTFQFTDGSGNVIKPKQGTEIKLAGGVYKYDGTNWVDSAGNKKDDAFIQARLKQGSQYYFTKENEEKYGKERLVKAFTVGISVKSGTSVADLDKSIAKWENLNARARLNGISPTSGQSENTLWTAIKKKEAQAFLDAGAPGMNPKDKARLQKEMTSSEGVSSAMYDKFSGKMETIRYAQKELGYTAPQSNPKYTEATQGMASALSNMGLRSYKPNDFTQNTDGTWSVKDPKTGKINPNVRIIRNDDGTFAYVETSGRLQQVVYFNKDGIRDVPSAGQTILTKAEPGASGIVRTGSGQDAIFTISNAAYRNRANPRSNALGDLLAQKVGAQAGERIAPAPGGGFVLLKKDGSVRAYFKNEENLKKGIPEKTVSGKIATSLGKGKTLTAKQLADYKKKMDARIKNIKAIDAMKKQAFEGGMSVADFNNLRNTANLALVKDQIATSKRLQSFNGNPQEIWHHCGKTCGQMGLKVDNDGNIIGERIVLDPKTNKPVIDPNTKKPMVVNTEVPFACAGGACEQCKGEALGKCDMFQEGAVLGDTQGRGWVIENVRFDDGKTKKKYKSVDECKKANKGKENNCKFDSKHQDYYWVPNTWTAFLEGGPAVNTMKSFGAMFPKFQDPFGYGHYLDTYFNLDNVATGACLGMFDVRKVGGVNPRGSQISTAHIQATKNKFEPCKATSGEAKTACLAKNNMTATKQYWWKYRITGTVIPKDCGMEFNIQLDGSDLYDRPRKLAWGEPPFDFTAGKSLILDSKETPDDAEKVCIVFSRLGLGTRGESKDDTCMMTKDKKICNKIVDLTEKETLELPIEYSDVYGDVEDTTISITSASSTTEGLNY